MKTTVSHNEIVMFCRKALEGLGVSTGELEDAADAVGWLALNGFDPIPPFHELLRELHSPMLRSDNETTFNCMGQSCLLIAPPTLDYACAQAVQNGQSTLTLRNTLHPHFLFFYVIRCAQRGIHIAAQWRAPDAAHETRILIQPGDPAPTMIEWELDAGKAAGPIPSGGIVTVTLLLATNAPIDVSMLPPPHNSHSNRREYPPAHFAAQRQHHVENGIQVDAKLWAKIQEIGKRVLVEATEESRRRGAGEDAS